MGIEIVIIVQTVLALNIGSYYVEYYMVALATRRLVRPELFCDMILCVDLSEISATRVGFWLVCGGFGYLEISATQVNITRRLVRPVLICVTVF